MPDHHPGPSDVVQELRRTLDRLRVAADEVARRHGLSAAQYAVLDALGRAPGLHGAALARACLDALDRAPDLSGTPLARACFVTPRSMDDLLERLVEAGLVERTTGPSAGHRPSARLTGAGSTLLAAVTTQMEAVQGRMVSTLTPGQVADLSAGLRAYADALEGASDTPPVREPSPGHAPGSG
jgi:DNA-binding MarR family transcriptional regulator